MHKARKGRDSDQMVTDTNRWYKRIRDWRIENRRLNMPKFDGIKTTFMDKEQYRIIDIQGKIILMHSEKEVLADQLLVKCKAGSRSKLMEKASEKYSGLSYKDCSATYERAYGKSASHARNNDVPIKLGTVVSLKMVQDLQRKTQANTEKVREHDDILMNHAEEISQLQGSIVDQANSIEINEIKSRMANYEQQQQQQPSNIIWNMDNRTAVPQSPSNSTMYAVNNTLNTIDNQTSLTATASTMSMMGLLESDNAQLDYNNFMDDQQLSQNNSSLNRVE